MNARFCVIKLISLFCFFIFVSPCYGTITPLQSLDFGTIVVTKNLFSGSISIDPAGNMQIVGGIAVIETGNHAVYELSDLPPNQTIDVDVVSLNGSMIPVIASEETFTFTVATTGNPIITDENGVAILNVGGTISTSASGQIRFTDTQYNATIQITINL